LTYDRRVGPSEYRGNLNALVNAIKAASPNSPIFLTHPPIATSPWVLSDGATRSQYDAEIQSLAISQNLPVIDLRSALTASDYSDGIHPTALGQSKLAAVYNAALRF
jgi:lysophospholipase L1-like esterase